MLSNRGTGSVTRAAYDLASIALPESYVPPVKRVTAEVCANALLAYAGDYEIEPGITLTVSVDVREAPRAGARTGALRCVS